MPNWFPSWTKCCAPANYRGLPVGAMVAISTLGAVMGTIAGLGGVSALSASGFWAVLYALSPGVALFLASLCLAAMAFCTWWLDVRLICLGGDRSAIGAIYHLEPPVQTSNPFDIVDADTDFSFNLLLW